MSTCRCSGPGAIGPTLLCLSLICAVLTGCLAAPDKSFKHDVDSEEEESGEKFQLHSQGKLADLIDLDSLDEVKRVACVGDRLLVKLTDSAMAHKWRVGQVVVGGLKWGCNASHAHPRSRAIYVKISAIAFPLEDQVVVHHVPAGPFDMLKEADIHFYYKPGEKNSGHHSDSEKKMRFRRSLSNLVSNILNNIDWRANFTTTIPLSVDDVTDNDSGITMALHKNLGQAELNMSVGWGVHDLQDDFLLILDNVIGHTQLAYRFVLVIRNIEGNAQVERYVSQFELMSKVDMDAAITFRRELGLTYNVTAFTSPTIELFRVPVASVTGLPPVYLTVTYQVQTLITVQAYSGGEADLRTAFNTSGYLLVDQLYDAVTKKESDVWSRDWSVEAKQQALQTPYLTHVRFSLYQKFKFTPAVSWHYHDVDIELSPPVEISVQPEVHLHSSPAGVGRCVDADVTVTCHVRCERAVFTADAFGMKLWNVPLQPAMNRDIQLVNASLGQGCEARCHGSVSLNSGLLNTTIKSPRFSREDADFQILRTLSGDTAQFVDNNISATWCGKVGTPCHSCSPHAPNTSPSVTCAARLMTSRLAAVLTYLAELVTVEWPDKQLLILEAWDEPSSVFPAGRHGSSSLFAHGRAASVTVTDRTPVISSPLATGIPTTTTTTTILLSRLAQLAVCAGADGVIGVDADDRLEVAVAFSDTSPSADERTRIFWKAMNELDVTALSPLCQQAPSLSPGDQWPTNGGPEVSCGPVDTPLYRADRNQMAQLIQWNLTDISMIFEAEGPPSEWCGSPTRQCLDCSSPSSSSDPWDWCSSRMMTPRLAIRLRKLQKLASERGMGVRVIKAFSEPSQRDATLLVPSLFDEGRGIRLASWPGGRERDLVSLAVCAGFDHVTYTSSAYIDAFVLKQDGPQALLVTYFEGEPHVTTTPPSPSDLEYSYPQELLEESVRPDLLDGGFPLNTQLSHRLVLDDVITPDKRYFRLDPALIECFEMAADDFSGNIEMMRGSVYRTRSSNFLHNLDLRHPQEKWRFETGQAMCLRPVGSSDNSHLLSLARSILRECPPLVRTEMRGLGLGCHSDHLYVDFRPVTPGYERHYVTVWKVGDAAYCQDVINLQRQMIEGGPVIQSMPSIACGGRGLDPGLEFLSFQYGQQGHCQVSDQDTFCQASRQVREKAADSLQALLTSAAGHGRLPRYDIIGEVRACLVDVCGGCPGVGPVFEQKMVTCARLVRKYVTRAASPFPDLRNVIAFFNTDTALSTVHHLACGQRLVCVEDTPTYSLFVPTVTARYYPDPSKSLEKALFAADINPTPLLEIVAQEMAFRAEGKVTVFVESETDIYALRNVLKVLMVYNKNISFVEFQVAAEVDPDLVTSSIQRKLEAWSGVACPLYSRFAVAPFVVVTMTTERQRRSAQLSVPRNKVKWAMYNWEQEWLDKMF